jgi:hypothetical protein
MSPALDSGQSVVLLFSTETAIDPLVYLQVGSVIKKPPLVTSTWGVKVGRLFGGPKALSEHRDQFEVNIVNLFDTVWFCVVCV